MTIFTDQLAAVEELEFLANTTGEPHAIVHAFSGAKGRWRVVAMGEIGRRKPLVVCDPEVAHG